MTRDRDVPFIVVLDAGSDVNEVAVATALWNEVVEPDTGLVLISVGVVVELFASRTSLPFLRCLSLIDVEDLELLRE